MANRKQNIGRIPVLPGTLTEVFFRNGSSRVSRCPEGWRWEIWNAPRDIIDCEELENEKEELK
jgi:hypothetical protein